MALPPEIQELLAEQNKLMRKLLTSVGGGGASPFAAPVEASALRALDRRTNKLMPLVRDPASLGLMIWSDWPERYRITEGVLAAAAATMYTATEDLKDCMLRICLVDTSQRTFSVELIPGGQSTGDKQTIFSTGTILPVGHPGYTQTGFGLRSGDVLRGVCSSASKVAWNLYALRSTGAV